MGMIDLRFTRFKLALGVGVGLLGYSFGYGADTLRLSLEDCYRLAREQGLSAQRVEWQWRSVEAQYRGERAGLYPQLSLKFDTPSWWEALDERVIYDPVTGRQVLYQIPSGERRYQSQLSLLQNLPWGAEWEFSARLYRRFWFWNKDQDRIELKEYSLLNRISLYQPLLEGNPVRRRWEIAQRRYQVGRLEYEENWRELYYRLATLFYQLLSAQGELRIAQDDYRVGEEALRLAERKLKAGLIPEVELLQIQLDLSRREVALRSAESALLSAQEQLLSELDYEGEVVVEPIFAEDESLTKEEVVLAPPEESVEVLRLRLEREQTELENRAQMLSERVKAWVRLSYDTDARRQSLDSLNLPTSRNRGISFHLEFPLWGFGSTGAKVEALQAQIRRAELAEREAVL
ncbi:MAG: TolC family protein, partial [bacterium]